MKVRTVLLLALAAITLFSYVLAQRGGRRPPFPLQLALDANSDGVIAGEEMNNAPAALRKLDKNNDGQLTEAEMRPNFERGRPGGPAGNDNNDAVNSLLAFDENKDGKLAKSEVPERMQSMFARGDADRDGFLTRDELTKLAAAQNVAADNTGGGERGERAGERHDDHNERGERGEREGGRGGGPGSFAEMMRRMPLMAALDANSDGTLSGDEIEKSPVALKTLDKNSDGQLTADELRPAFGGRREGERPPQRPPSN